MENLEYTHPKKKRFLHLAVAIGAIALTNLVISNIDNFPSIFKSEVKKVRYGYKEFYVFKDPDTTSNIYTVKSIPKTVLSYDSIEIYNGEEIKSDSSVNLFYYEVFNLRDSLLSRLDANEQMQYDSLKSKGLVEKANTFSQIISEVRRKYPKN